MDSKITGLHSFTGSLRARDIPEPDTQDDSNAIKLVFATSGEYPDGTKWDRKATPDEKEEYESWMG